MANEVRVIVFCTQLEVPVIGREPRIHDLDDADAAVSENQRPWGLLAAMPGVAFHADCEDRFSHDS